MMDRISIILGAGFSFNSGLPMAKGINEYFIRNNKDKLLHFSSDEWKWYDLATDPEQTNGRLSYDWIAYGYMLNEMVSEFVKIEGEFKNYEEFYQFIIDGLSQSEFLTEIGLKALQKFDLDESELKKEKYFYDLYSEAFFKPDIKQVYRMINYLISELLYWRKPFKSFSSQYNTFINFISKFKQNDIFTLNHDLLLEALLNQNGIDFSDGFSTSNSCLRTRKGMIKCFDGIYNSNITLLKLHGSIDLYKYECADQKGSFLNPTGEFIYYKTNDYYEKQIPKRIDIKSGKIIQDFHWNITPQFITGVRKEELISSDLMYKNLFNAFSQRIGLADTLLIIGYSYMDKHINKLISENLTNQILKKIINVNPNDKFPYSTKNEIEIVNKKYIDEL